MKRRNIFSGIFFLFFFATLAAGYAGQYDLKQMTPEVDRALKNRQGRYSQLQVMKREGLIGENNRGYVTALKGDPAAEALTVAENGDRQVIYRALVEQNSLGPNGMREVERAFAEVQSEKASVGEMVQSSSGDWAGKRS